MMIRAILLGFLIFFSALVLPTNISAHVLKYDGSIGAVLHVNPEDDPIAGEVSNFFFEFKDKKNKFIPGNCDCVVKVIKDGSEVFTQNLFKDNSNPSLTNISFSYTFPSLGIYSIVINGKSKDGSFDSFSLKYDVRVARMTSNQPVATTTPTSNWFLQHQLHIILPLAIAFGTLVIYVMTRKRK